jgi:hypothetical protein
MILVINRVYGVGIGRALKKKPRASRGLKTLQSIEQGLSYANTLRLLPFNSVLYWVSPELAGPPVTEPAVVNVEP